MERLDELEAVQRDEQLVARAAAHVELGGEVVSRDAGKTRHRAVDVLAELRDRLETIARERVRRGEARLQETEVAGNDDDFGERERSTPHRETEHSVDEVLGQPHGESQRLVAEAEDAKLVTTGRHAAEREAAALARIGGEACADEIDAGA